MVRRDTHQGRKGHAEPVVPDHILYRIEVRQSHIETFGVFRHQITDAFFINQFAHAFETDFQEQDDGKHRHLEFVLQVTGVLGNSHADRRGVVR